MVFVYEINAEEAKRLVYEKKNAVFIDVRGIEDYKESRIKSCYHIAFEKLVNINKEELKNFEGKKIIVVCYHGNRSKVAVYSLRKLGFDAVSLKGGINEWKRLGLECA